MKNNINDEIKIFFDSVNNWKKDCYKIYQTKGKKGYIKILKLSKDY